MIKLKPSKKLFLAVVASLAVFAAVTQCATAALRIMNMGAHPVVSVLNARLKMYQETSRQLPTLPEARAVQIVGNTASIEIRDWPKGLERPPTAVRLEQDYRYGEVWQQYYSEVTGLPNPHVVTIFKVFDDGRVFRQDCCDKPL